MGSRSARRRGVRRSYGSQSHDRHEINKNWLRPVGLLAQPTTKRVKVIKASGFKALLIIMSDSRGVWCLVSLSVLGTRVVSKVYG